jgi:N-acetyl-anhydromuramyl-L-alanine amidase AmpD
METYIIRPGDTLFSIAAARGVPLGALATLNGIADVGQIRAGRQILLPALTSETSERFAQGIVPAVGRAAEVPINRSMRLAPGQFFTAREKKDLIVLHFTAGSTAAGAFQSWQSSPVEVGTAYILDTDGVVYEVFPPECWAYHLGIQGAASEGHRHDKRSIGIEIVNPGGLVRRGDMLYWWPRNYTASWCRVADTGQYVQAKFRGIDYWATFGHAQSVSLIRLVNWLSATHDIPGKIPGEDIRGAFNPAAFAGFRGIASHQNFRADKTDIGPAFDWEMLR